MCHYKFFIFTSCGHTQASETPLTKRCPPCPSKTTTDIFATPSLSSPVRPIDRDSRDDKFPSPWELEVSQSLRQPGRVADAIPVQGHTEDHVCRVRQTHPFQTYVVHTLCPPCATTRLRRLARLEATAIRSEVDREVLRRRNRTKAEQQQRQTIDALRDGNGMVSNGARAKRKELKLVAGSVGPDAQDAVKSFDFGKVRDGLLGFGWSSGPAPMVSTAIKEDGMSLGVRTIAVSAGISYQQNKSQSPETTSPRKWLDSPRLRRSLNMKLNLPSTQHGHKAAGMQDEILRPEHFAVSTLLHGSMESLITSSSDATSRRVSRDSRGEGGG